MKRNSLWKKAKCAFMPTLLIFAGWGSTVADTSAQAPGIAKRSITCAIKTPTGTYVVPQAGFPGMGVPTDRPASGEDWWYDIAPYMESGVQTGYMVCGFTTYKNMFMDETGYTPRGFMTQNAAPVWDFDATCERRLVGTESLSHYRQAFAKFDMNGDMIWCRVQNYSGPLTSIINTADGGHIAVGELMASHDKTETPFIYNPDGVGDVPLMTQVRPITDFGGASYYRQWRMNVTKFDAAGNVTWSYLYGYQDMNSTLAVNSTRLNGQSLYGIDIVEKSTGTGYIVLGSGNIVAGGPWGLFLLDLDLNGNLLNKRFLGGTENLSAGNIDCSGGTCIIAGGYIDAIAGKKPAFLVKVDEATLNLHSSWGTTWGSGNPKTYTPAATTESIFKDVLLNTDGSIICAGILNKAGCYWSGDGNYGTGSILKFNSTGTLAFKTDFGEVRAYDMREGLTRTAEGGYAVVTSKRIGPAVNLLANPYPAIITNFNAQASNYTTGDCYTGSTAPNAWNTDTYIGKFNASLSLLWEKTFDSDDQPPVNHPGDFKKQECMYQIAEAPDGAFVVVGNSSHNLDDYFLAKVFSDCQLKYNYLVRDNSDNIITISGATTWNTPQTVIGKIVIPSGASLTISNTTVEFADSRRTNINTRIVVQTGGRLIINNSTLTSLQACEGAMWDGIEVQGNSALRQTPSSNQGYVSISNNSYIRNARNGVTTRAFLADNYSTDWTKTGGGIVQANGSNFINNFRSFEFMGYHGTLSNGSPANDQSGITLCNFETNSSFGDGGYIKHPYAHITMNDTRKIGIRGNKFENLRTVELPEQRGSGIFAIDASFEVLPACNITTLPPCPPANTVKNRFLNLYSGVAVSGGSSNQTVTVDRAYFDNNIYGVRIEGAHNGQVIRNEFHIPRVTITGLNYTYGVYTNSAYGYKIEDNDFIGEAGTGQNMGAYTRFSDAAGTGVSNFMNDYTNLSVGTQAASDNLTLQIDCNRFYKSTNGGIDINVTVDGWLANQGTCSSTDPKLPQANEFIGICNGGANSQMLNSGFSTFLYRSYPFTSVGIGTPCVIGPITESQCTAITYTRANACTTTLPPLDGGIIMRSSNLEQTGQMLDNLNAQIQRGNKGEELRQDQQFYTMEYRTELNNTLIDYLNAGEEAKALALLAEQKDAASMSALVAMLAQENPTKAQSYLAVLSVEAERLMAEQPKKASELEAFCRFYRFLIPVLQRPGTYFTLSAEEKAQLEAFAQNETGIAATAQGILNFVSENLPIVNGDLIVFADEQSSAGITEATPVQNHMQVYPNPSNGQFDIKFLDENGDPKSIAVYTLEGRVVYQTQSTEERPSLQLGHLNAGIYLLKVVTGNRQYVQRIVLSK